MILPTTFTPALLLVLLSLVCWSYWANTYKMGGKRRFELYYWDFAIAVPIVAILAALTFGSLGFDGFLFSDDLMRAGKHNILYAFLAGVIFNLGSMLLVAGISVAGMSLAFPITASVGILCFAAWRYEPGQPHNPALLIAGLSILVVSIITAAFAYRSAEVDRATQMIRAGKTRSTKPKIGLRGVFLTLAAGVILGSIYPLMAKCRVGDNGLGPYSLAVLFSIGLFSSAVPFNLFFMNLPVQGQPLEVLDYFRRPLKQHWLGMIGGAVWAVGLVSSLVVSTAESAHISDALISAAIPSSALLCSLVGLFVWRELEGLHARTLAKLAMALFSVGAVLIWTGPFLFR